MTTIQMRGKGNITLPVNLRKKYNLEEGDVFTLIDLGEGSFMLTPQRSEVNRLGERISRIVDAEKIDLDDLLVGLDEERESYYRERYEAQ